MPFTARKKRGPFSYLCSEIALGLFVLIASVLTVGCGGAQPEVADPSEASATDAAASPSSPESTESTGATAPAKPLCVVEDATEDAKLMYSDENDWFLYVSNQSVIDCENDRNIVKVDMLGVHLNVFVTPLSDGMSLDSAVSQFSEAYLKGLTQSMTFSESPEFAETKIGEQGRRAFFSDAAFQADDQKLRLLTMVTAALNTHGAAIIHIVYWKLEESDFLQNQKDAMETIEAISSSWYRQSDTDDEGKIVNMW